MSLRSALVSALILALFLACLISEPSTMVAFSSAFYVFITLRFLIYPLRWAGMLLWVWSHAQNMATYFISCAEYEERFGPVQLRPAARYVRNYTIFMIPMTVLSIFHVFLYFTEQPLWFQLAINISFCGIGGGPCFWLSILDGMSLSLAEAFRQISERLSPALASGDVPQLRLLVRQHGHVSRLAGMFCHTFGGLLTICVYTMVLDVSLAIYIAARLAQAPDVSLVVSVVVERLASLSPIVMLKLTSTAGHKLSRESQRPAELVRGHMLDGTRTADDSDYTDALQQLEGQRVDMNMDGYFILGRDFFIENMKDIITLIIAFAQFDMAT